MSDTEPAPRPVTDDPENSGLHRSRRALSAVAVGVCVVLWWPAFTLGAWGEVFFEQVLTLWAAATASFLLVAFSAGGHHVRRPVAATLLLPSVWIILEILPIERGTTMDTAVSWFGALLTLVGLPVMAWIILRVVRPEVADEVPRRTWVGAAGAVAVVALLSILLGWLNPFYLHCEDFIVSGNSTPPHCTPGGSPRT